MAEYKGDSDVEEKIGSECSFTTVDEYLCSDSSDVSRPTTPVIVSFDDILATIDNSLPKEKLSLSDFGPKTRIQPKGDDIKNTEDASDPTSVQNFPTIPENNQLDHDKMLEESVSPINSSSSPNHPFLPNESSSNLKPNSTESSDNSLFFSCSDVSRDADVSNRISPDKQIWEQMEGNSDSFLEKLADMPHTESSDSEDNIDSNVIKISDLALNNKNNLDKKSSKCIIFNRDEYSLIKPCKVCLQVLSSEELKNLIATSEKVTNKVSSIIEKKEHNISKAKRSRTPLKEKLSVEIQSNENKSSKLLSTSIKKSSEQNNLFNDSTELSFSSQDLTSNKDDALACDQDLPTKRLTKRKTCAFKRKVEKKLNVFNEKSSSMILEDEVLTHKLKSSKVNLSCSSSSSSRTAEYNNSCKNSLESFSSQCPSNKNQEILSTSDQNFYSLIKPCQIVLKRLNNVSEINSCDLNTESRCSTSKKSTKNLNLRNSMPKPSKTICEDSLIIKSEEGDDAKFINEEAFCSSSKCDQKGKKHTYVKDYSFLIKPCSIVLQRMPNINQSYMNTVDINISSEEDEKINDEFTDSGVKTSSQIDAPIIMKEGSDLLKEKDFAGFKTKNVNSVKNYDQSYKKLLPVIKPCSVLLRKLSSEHIQMNKDLSENVNKIGKDKLEKSDSDSSFENIAKIKKRKNKKCFEKTEKEDKSSEIIVTEQESDSDYCLENNYDKNLEVPKKSFKRSKNEEYSQKEKNEDSGEESVNIISKASTKSNQKLKGDQDSEESDEDISAKSFTANRRNSGSTSNSESNEGRRWLSFSSKEQENCDSDYSNELMSGKSETKCKNTKHVKGGEKKISFQKLMKHSKRKVLSSSLKNDKKKKTRSLSDDCGNIKNSESNQLDEIAEENSKGSQYYVRSSKMSDEDESQLKKFAKGSRRILESSSEISDEEECQLKKFAKPSRRILESGSEISDKEESQLKKFAKRSRRISESSNEISDEEESQLKKFAKPSRRILESGSEISDEEKSQLKKFAKPSRKILESGSETSDKEESQLKKFAKRSRRIPESGSEISDEEESQLKKFAKPSRKVLESSSSRDYRKNKNKNICESKKEETKSDFGQSSSNQNCKKSNIESSGGSRTSRPRVPKSEKKEKLELSESDTEKKKSDSFQSYETNSWISDNNEEEKSSSSKEETFYKKIVKQSTISEKNMDKSNFDQTRNVLDKAKSNQGREKSHAGSDDKDSIPMKLLKYPKIVIKRCSLHDAEKQNPPDSNKQLKELDSNQTKLDFTNNSEQKKSDSEKRNKVSNENSIIKQVDEISGRDNEEKKEQNERDNSRVRREENSEHSNFLNDEKRKFSESHDSSEEINEPESDKLNKKISKKLKIDEKEKSGEESDDSLPSL